MLTRLYIDNFKCFENFEYAPAQRQLILGSNGSGKSSLMDALLVLRRFLVFGEKAEDIFSFSDRTKWLSKVLQRFRVEATLDGNRYVYRLELDPPGDPAKPEVALESLHVNNKLVFDFQGGRARTYSDESKPTATYPLDSSRSALAMLFPRDDARLAGFKQWMENVFCFQIDPLRMTLRAEREDAAPKFDLSNFAAWYRHLALQYPHDAQELYKSLRAALDGFEHLRLESVGQSVRLLMADFAKDGSRVSFGFNQLSDGQRNLICLYTILHFIIAKGGTVVLDEPDNFISLREIQPWLMAVDDAIEDHGGQVLIISHHPELINQWAPSYGARFVRDGMNGARVVKFQGDPDSLLAPAELIARGWEGE